MNEGETIRVVIVDDHALFRRGLDLVLSEEPDIKVVGEAADGIEAVHRAEEMAPDVVVMDVLGHDFFLFTNAENGHAAVLYRRRDGNLGVIETTG